MFWISFALHTHYLSIYICVYIDMSVDVYICTIESFQRIWLFSTLCSCAFYWIEACWRLFFGFLTEQRKEAIHLWLVVSIE